MKKFFILFLTIITTLSLAACYDEKTEWSRDDVQTVSLADYTANGYNVRAIVNLVLDVDGVEVTAKIYLYQEIAPDTFDAIYDLLENFENQLVYEDLDPICDDENDPDTCREVTILPNMLESQQVHVNDEYMSLGLEFYSRSEYSDYSDNDIETELESNEVETMLTHDAGTISLLTPNGYTSTSASQVSICLDTDGCSDFADDRLVAGSVVEGLSDLQGISTTANVTISKFEISHNPEDYLNVNNSLLTNTRVEMKIVGYDAIITIELFDTIAPSSVENFLDLISEKFYDYDDNDTDEDDSDDEYIIFHRVSTTYNIIQAGATDCTLTSTSSSCGSTGNGSADGEFASNGWINPVRFYTGVLGMARSSSYDSATSQFFIQSDSYHGFYGDYAVFGYIVNQEGRDIISQIQQVQIVSASTDGRPLENVAIEYIRLAE